MQDLRISSDKDERSDPTHRRRGPHRGPGLRRFRVSAGLLFVSPWLIGFLAFTLYPFGASLYYSFTDFSGVGTPHFVGLNNYRNLLSDHLLVTALWNTVFYTVLEVPLSVAVALLLALLLNMRVKGQSVYRTLLYVPSVVPLVASAILWLWLFNPSYGLVNAVLTGVGIRGPGWMYSVTWSKPTFVLLGIWGVGTPMVIYLAALKGIPKYMYEVASLEGAGPFQRLRFITLPMVGPATVFNAVLALVAALQYFAQAYIMTQGGPDNSTLFYSLYLYEQAFQYLHFGYASAMAWVLFVIVVAITLVLLRAMRRHVYYAGQGRG